MLICFLRGQNAWEVLFATRTKIPGLDPFRSESPVWGRSPSGKHQSISPNQQDQVDHCISLSFILYRPFRLPSLTCSLPGPHQRLRRHIPPSRVHQSPVGSVRQWATQSGRSSPQWCFASVEARTEFGNDATNSNRRTRTELLASLHYERSDAILQVDPPRPRAIKVSTHITETELAIASTLKPPVILF